MLKICLPIEINIINLPESFFGIKFFYASVTCVLMYFLSFARFSNHSNGILHTCLDYLSPCEPHSAQMFINYENVLLMFSQFHILASFSFAFSLSLSLSRSLLHAHNFSSLLINRLSWLSLYFQHHKKYTHSFPPSNTHTYATRTHILASGLPSFLTFLLDFRPVSAHRCCNTLNCINSQVRRKLNFFPH